MEAVRCVGGVLELRVKEKQGKVHRWEVVVGWGGGGAAGDGGVDGDGVMKVPETDQQQDGRPARPGGQDNSAT